TISFTLPQLTPTRSTHFPYTTLFRSCGNFFPLRFAERLDRASARTREDGEKGDGQIHCREEKTRSEKSRCSKESCPGKSDSRKRSEEHTSELQSRENLVCRLLLEKKN